MNYYRILFFIFSLCLSASLHSQTLDINDFLERVRTHSKDLKLAVKQQESAAVQKKMAVSTALPKIVSSVDYTRNLTDYYMYADMSMLTGRPGVAKFKVKRNNELAATIALRQTIFSPSVGSAIKAAVQYKKLTDFVYAASEQAITNGAKKLFYQCLLLEKVVDVSVSSEKNAARNYENIKLKYDNGQVSEFQLLQARVRWKNAVPATNEARKNLSLAMNNLKNWAGIPVENKVTLSGQFYTPDLPAETDIERALEKRPDFNALLWEKKLRMTNLGAKKASFLPTLTATLAHAYTAQSDEFKLEQDNGLTFAGLSLSLPIFLGGARTAAVEEARIEVDKTQLTIEKQRDDIYNELVNVRLRLKEAHSRIESAESILNVAEKAFTIAENTAKSGLTTQLELKDARVGYDQARLNYYAAVYDYLEAYFDWEKASGGKTD